MRNRGIQKPETSAVSKKDPWEVNKILLILFMESLGTLMYNFPFCITGVRWKSKITESFTVGALQFDVAVLPEILHILL